MRKARVLVVINLDDMPGTMHTAESAREVVQNVLYQRMSHYKPAVSLAPAPTFDTSDIQTCDNEGSNAA